MNTVKSILILGLFFFNISLFAQLEVSFSHERGYYAAPFQLTIECNDIDAIIKYTLDYKEPSPSYGTVYSSPINIDGNQVVRIIAYTDEDTTQIISQSYFNIAQIKSNLSLNNYPDSIINSSFNSIPTVSIVNEIGTAFENDVERKASIEWLPFENQEGVHAFCGVKNFGGTFTNFAKKSFRVYFRKDYGTKTLKYPIFGNTKDNVATEFEQIDFRSGSHDMHFRGFYMSSSFVDQAFSEMGNQSTHGIHVNLFLNGQYWGQYYMRERFGADYLKSYFGGEEDDFECLNGNYNVGAQWNAGVPYDGDGSLWASAKSQSNYAEIKEKVDLNNIIDYMLLYFYGRCENEYRCGASSSGAPKFIFQMNDTDGFLRSGFGGDFGANTTTGPGNIFGNLRTDNHEDFNILLADRIYRHFVHPQGFLTGNVSIERLTKLCNNVETSMITECARWNYRTYASWETARDNTFPILQDKETDVFSALKTRGDYTLLDAVLFDKYGGQLNQGETITLTNPNPSGNIYYTVDGSDPRLPGGDLNPNAILYQTPIMLSKNVTQLFARVFDSTKNDVRDRWSAGTPELYYLPINYSNLKINEIYYAPKDSIYLNPITNTTDTVGGKNFEFIEVKNIGNDTIYLTNTIFTKGISLKISTIISIPPSGFAVFVEDANWFELRYGFTPDEEYSGKLDNNGEKIILSDPFGNIIDSVRYYNSNPWDEAPSDKDHTLELLHPSLNNDNPLNWFRSDYFWGTPGSENSRICAQSATPIIFNEINYNSNNDVLDAGDWVELYNPGQNIVDLSGWTFYDNGNQFILPAGTVIAPDGYLVLVEDADLFSAAFPNVTNYLIVGNWDFTLSKKGERISLFDQNKCLSDYVVYNDKAPWPETPDGDGPTLALLDATLDNALASSWEASDVITAYFVNGSPGQPNTCIPGQSCDDGDPCTGNDIFDENCNCAGTFVLQDDDNDGVCNLIDQCPNFDNALIGTPCDDGDICTNGETYDENCGCSGGVIDDIDNDGICDPLDDCDNNLTGTPCDDGDICTAGETYDEDCNCTGGIFQDADNDGICDAEDICPNLENNLLGQLCDDGDPLTEFDTYNANTCSCSGIIASAEICVNISSSEDDAEEQVDNGVVTLASGDLDMVNDEGVIFLAGMRFQNIDIPQGATITNATIQFAADEINTDPTNLTIKAEAIDHAPVFEASENNISNRTLTDASIIWQPDPWNTIGDNAIAQKTVDISPIIQEIIDRPGFVAGKAIALIINGTGIRTAESFDGDQNLPPQLCITYSTGLCVENYPCDDNDPTTINDVYDENCDCVGENIRLNAKIMLEGFYDAQNNNMHTKLNSKNLIPLNQPYNIVPWNYGGDESVSSIPEDAVDWILLISRDSEGNVLDQAVGFVNQNGDLMHLDGTLGIPIATGEGNKFSIHHRSHLAILASNNYDGLLYDFTLGENQAAGNGQLKLIDGKYMLYAGDYDGKGIINSADFNDWKIQGAVINQYLSIDGDGNGIINSLDYNLWTNNKSKVGHPSIRY